MIDLLLRFLVGGLMVSAFSFLGCLFSPKSFAGLFGAAPSIALATLSLTLFKDGKHFAAIEAHAMILGAIAFFSYASYVSSILMKKRISPLRATMLGMIIWFAGAFGLLLLWADRAAAR